MKKTIAMLLALVLVVGLFAGCGSTTETPAATTAAAAAEPAATEAPAAAGSVYYLNFKPEADEAWKTLAQSYTDQTGVPVKIVTAASGTYSDTLTTEMGKSSAPTLFQCGNMAGLKDWDEYCYDLTNTEVAQELTTSDFNLYNADGQLKCIGYCYEAFGLIVNKDLLTKAGHTVDEIKDFASLKAVVEDITARSSELGFSAFTSAGLDGSSSWRFSGHLANLPLYYEGVTADSATITNTYLPLYKNIWDLYINNATCQPTELASKTGDEAEAEFGEGKAVFFQNGTWEYANLTEKFGMSDEQLAMIPIYCGAEGEENTALCCGTENCWAVNAKASQEDIDATLAFLKWVVTSDEGTQMMADNFGPIPFKSAKEPKNVFFADANKLIADGKKVVTWAFNYTPNVDDWRAGVVSALMAYSAGQGEWSAVESAFVDGWATQWALANG